MDRTACTEPQCLYKDALYVYLFKDIAGCGLGMFADTVLGFVRRHAKEIYIQNRVICLRLSVQIYFHIAGLFYDIID
jgi:hypothetical protein